MSSRLEQYRRDPLAFFSDLKIRTQTGVCQFSKVMIPFQRERFAALAPAMLAIVNGQRPEIGRHWWSATKGFSKSSDMAAAILWLLAFSPRPLECQVAASDQDQAAETRKAAKDLLYLNPWLAERVAVHNWRIACDATGSAAEIIAADVAGSHGARPDVVFIDELSHVTKQEFAENLLDNAAKVNSLVVIATNAGMLGTWQYTWREIARTSPDRWYFSRWDKPSPWISEAEISEARRRNSRSRFERLWHDVWATGHGDALDPEDIEACVDRRLEPDRERRDGWCYDAGLDLGITNDRAALVVLASSPIEYRIRLVRCQSWAPGPSGQVDLEAVRIAVLQAQYDFRPANVCFDPYAAQLMSQQLRRSGVNMVQINFTGKALNAMATLFLQTFRNRTIRMYHDEELIRDISRISIEERPFGYKLTAPRTKDGHADRATALALALLGSDHQFTTFTPPDNSLPPSLLSPEDLCFGGPRAY